MAGTRDGANNKIIVNLIKYCVHFIESYFRN